MSKSKMGETIRGIFPPIGEILPPIRDILPPIGEILPPIRGMFESKRYFNKKLGSK